jgi:hypothetical protein
MRITNAVSRALATFLVLVTAPALAASSDLRSHTNPPLQDCVLHVSLTRSFSARALRQAIKTMPYDVKTHSSCPAALRSQLSGVTKAPMSAKVARVYRDVSADGFLSSAYSAATLRRALRHVGPDLVQYTFAVPAMRSQLVLYRR